jgi:hypothetical protein
VKRLAFRTGKKLYEWLIRDFLNCGTMFLEACRRGMTAGAQSHQTIVRQGTSFIALNSKHRNFLGACVVNPQASIVFSSLAPSLMEKLARGWKIVYSEESS